jgi:hypothetical protein
MSASLEAFAEFFGIDSDLVEAAAERFTVVMASTVAAEAVQGIISAMTDADKTTMLSRRFDGDPHVAAELQATVRDRMASDTNAPPIVARTVGELRARAAAIGLARERAGAERLAAEHKRRVEEAEKARQARLLAIARRGEVVWREVETEIDRRNAAAYDKAAGLLLDLQAVAKEQGTIEDFLRRLHAIREKHVRKERFIERLAALE